MIERSGLCHFKALNLLFLNSVLNTACSDFNGRYCTQKWLYNIVIYIATEYDFRNICLKKEIDNESEDRKKKKRW